MSVQSIRCGLPFCNHSTEEQKNSSIAMRTVTIALGALSLLAGILSIYEIPGFVCLGTTGGWALIATGGFFAILAMSLKCVQIKLVREANPPEHSFVDKVDPRSDKAISQDIIPADSPVFIPPSDGTCLFLQDTFCLEMSIYIASFLGARDLVNASTVSKHFLSIMRSEYIWSEYLCHLDFRIWGATRWSLKRGEDSYQFQIDNELNLEQENSIDLGDPFHQLRTYHELRKTEWGRIRSFDYFMRLMPGGPLAFQNIPVLNPIDAKNLLPTDMNGPVAYGKDLSGHSFFAIRVIDRSQHTDSAILIFIDVAKWQQEPNIYWEENQLSLDDTHVLNYILALMRTDNLAEREEFSSPLFIKAIELL